MTSDCELVSVGHWLVSSGSTVGEIFAVAHLTLRSLFFLTWNCTAYTAIGPIKTKGFRLNTITERMEENYPSPIIAHRFRVTRGLADYEHSKSFEEPIIWCSRAQTELGEETHNYGNYMKLPWLDYSSSMIIHLQAFRRGDREQARVNEREEGEKEREEIQRGRERERGGLSSVNSAPSQSVALFQFGLQQQPALSSIDWWRRLVRC